MRPDDEITVTLTAKEITARGDSRRGEVRWDGEVTNQDSRVAANYDVVTLMAASASRRR